MHYIGVKKWETKIDKLFDQAQGIFLSHMSWKGDKTSLIYFVHFLYLAHVFGKTSALVVLPGLQWLELLWRRGEIYKASINVPGFNSLWLGSFPVIHQAGSEIEQLIFSQDNGPITQGSQSSKIRPLVAPLMLWFSVLVLDKKKMNVFNFCTFSCKTVWPLVVHLTLFTSWAGEGFCREETLTLQYIWALEVRQIYILDHVTTNFSNLTSCQDLFSLDILYSHLRLLISKHSLKNKSI